jgi:tape measure domain-containing protein
MAGQAASLWVKLVISDKEFDQGLKRAENNLKRFGDRLNSLGTRLTVGFSVPMALAGVGAVKLAADLEQTKIAFEVMTGSAEKAGKMVENLQKMAAKTPYETGDLLDSAKTLMLFGVEAEKVQGMLQMLGDVASGSSEKLRALTLAFAQVQSTGRLTGQDLLQMVNAGFNPLQIISEKTGKSMADLKDAMSDGAISADMVTNAFKIATSEGGRFFGMMDKQSQTTLGKFSTFMDNAKLALTKLGEALLPFANKLIDALIPLTERLKDLSDWFSKLPEPIKNTTVAVVAFSVALGPVLILAGKITASFSGLIGVLRLLPLGAVTKGFDKIVFSIQAVAGGAATAKEAVGLLATSFGPFLVGGAVILGLVAVVDWMRKIREEQELLKKDAQSMNEGLELQKKIKAQSDQFKIARANVVASYGAEAFDKNGQLTKEVLRTQSEIVKDYIKARDDLNATILRANNLARNNNSVLKQNNKKPLDFDKDLETILKSGEKSALEKELERIEQQGEETAAALERIRLTEEEIAKLEGSYARKTIGGGAIPGQSDPLKDSMKDWDNWSKHIRDIASETANAMQSSFSDLFFDGLHGELKSLGDYFQSFVDSILRAWSNAMAQMITSQIMNGAFGSWLGGLFGGGGATAAAGAAGAAMPAYASGGSYGPGPMIVGEKGPELMIPRSSGTIIPNDKLGGVNVTVNVINNSGPPVNAKTTAPQFDGKQYVVGVVLEALNNNTAGMRDALQAVR